MALLGLLGMTLLACPQAGTDATGPVERVGPAAGYRGKVMPVTTSSNLPVASVGDLDPAVADAVIRLLENG